MKEKDSLFWDRERFDAEVREVGLSATSLTLIGRQFHFTSAERESKGDTIMGTIASATFKGENATFRLFPNGAVFIGIDAVYCFRYARPEHCWRASTTNGREIRGSLGFI
jgi:hypothetical protein